MSRRFGRFVPQSTITRRMDEKDLRFQREARRQAALRAAGLQPEVVPFVDVELIPVSMDTPGVVDVTLEPTGADVFGAPVKGEAVAAIPAIDPTGGQPRGRFGRRLDGRPVRLQTCVDCGAACASGLCAVCAAQRDVHTSALETRLAKARLPVKTTKEIA